MLVRIVRMSFHPKHITQFLGTFNTNKEQIRNFAGCQFLELYQDKSTPNIFFTYSYWENEMALNKYRDSDLFNEIWGKTKILFNDAPQAWSVDKISSLP
jgi:hypothetical protein